MSVSHIDVPTQFVEVDGIRYAYRRWGKTGTVPLFHVIHFRGGMDHWDPLLTDRFAKDREVILIDGRGVGSSSGTARDRIEDMADDIASVTRALGIPKVDLIGFSIGGFQVQEVTLRHPELEEEDFLFRFFGRSDEARAADRAFWKRWHEASETGHRDRIPGH